MNKWTNAAKKRRAVIDAASVKAADLEIIVSALRELLTAAARSGSPELVVQVGYFRDQTQEVRDIVSQVEREQTGGAGIWQVTFYPNEASAGIIEIIMEN